MNQFESASPAPKNLLPDQLAQWLTGAYLLAAIIVCVIAPFQARIWLNLPVAGALYQPGMLPAQLAVTTDKLNEGTNGIDPLEAPRLISLAEQPVRSSADLRSILSARSPGDQLTGTFQTRLGEKTIEITLSQLGDTQKIVFFALPYLIGTIYLICAIWIFLTLRYQSSARTFVIFAASVAISAAGWFDFISAHTFAYFWQAAILTAGAAIANLALLFPDRDPWVVRFPNSRYVIYLLTTILAILSIGMTDSSTRVLLSLISYVVCGLLILIGLAVMLFRRMKTASLVEEDQIRLILISAVISFLPAAIWFVGMPLWPRNAAISPYLFVTLIVFPIASGFAIQRYGLLKSDFLLKRTALYALMGIVIALGYAFLVTGLSLVFRNWILEWSVWMEGGLFFIIAMLLLPAYQSFKRKMDAAFMKGDSAYSDRLRTFSGELTHLIEIPEIIKVLRRHIEESLIPGDYHIFVYDPVTEQYLAAPDGSGKPSSDLRFGRRSGLVTTLEKMRFPMEVTVDRTLPLELMKEQTRLRLLNAEIYAPLSGNQHLAGWVALGARLSGRAYERTDLGYLDSLCDQAALAIERAQVVANLETRVRELNVLARVSQMINITLTLDDILELVYTQSLQIVPAENFSILLEDKASGTLYWKFLVQREDRLENEEEKPIGKPNILEKVVLDRGQAILTEDYQRECKKNGILCENPVPAHWMGLPLNAGAGTIGVMSISTYDSTITFNREQMNLLQAVADQAAGAIVKARLLEETEQRARQLATLNDLARQLSSTLELDPLLNHILDSAVDILNCEAGSLLLVDEQSQELVFKSTVGPVADELLGKRLPEGTGVVGKAVIENKPLIINDISQSPEWFSKPDEDTGFHTRSLLVVPLQAKDTVIGVVEVINRKDGLPFSQDDLDLLTSFAGQAAIAIENARLYTRTDQALEMKVEELSVMQRIDRDLTASLDVNHAMQITLDWAMRQSHAEAGLIGSVAGGQLQVIARKGYPQGVEINSNLDFQEWAAWFEAVEYGKITCINPGQNWNGSFLSDGATQILVPLRRETHTIGLLVLESALAPFGADPDIIQFLTRMSDHASIAVSNAQLYEEVQRANLAKSEFVSFVSHELKNPMTSIKGYTELILAGAVGPVNDAQKNFLGTIRSNVERMTTLVSDLADVSRIEAGRLRLDYMEVKVAEVVDEVMRSMKRQVEEKNQVVQVELPENLVEVWADKTRLNQIITNCISNAVKYTEAGGQIWIGAESCENRWDADGAPMVVHFWTRDSGIGISEQDQAKIFQKFFRSDDPKTREAPGTGLGLNITRSLVEYQGGKIWFESEYRKGTTFHFTIPIADK